MTAGVLPIGAILIGLRIHRIADRLPWLILVFGLGLLSVVNAVWFVESGLRGATTADNPLTLLLEVGGHLAVRSQHPRSPCHVAVLRPHDIEPVNDRWGHGARGRQRSCQRCAASSDRARGRQVSKIAVGSRAVTTMLGTSGSALMCRSTATLQMA